MQLSCLLLESLQGRVLRLATCNPKPKDPNLNAFVRVLERGFWELGFDLKGLGLRVESSWFQGVEFSGLYPKPKTLNPA